MKSSFVCLVAPGLHLSFACQCRKRDEVFTLLAPVCRHRGDGVRPYPECVTLPHFKRDPHRPNSFRRGFTAECKRATTSVPCNPTPPPPHCGSDTHCDICLCCHGVVWVCPCAARQLELGSAPSLLGALHGSCVDHTGMARRRVWQQLTLDLSGSLLGSQTQKHSVTGGPKWHIYNTF